MAKVVLGTCGRRAMESSYLAATFAHVRLLAGVHTLMDGQGRPLDKLLAAVGVLADVRTNAAVDALWQTR